MATFAKASFNASKYSSGRPSYPTELLNYITDFHRRGSAHPVSWERAVDLGCGTGQATRDLLAFKNVIGVDPSPGMLEKARESIPEDPAVQFQYLRGSAEDLSSTIPHENSVDLVTAAQACHWFNWDKVWPEVHRVLRPGGTAAFWVYAEFRLSQYRQLNKKITRYAQGTDPLNSLGPYFQRPGRTILERHLVDVPEPSEVLKGGGMTKFERVFFCGKEAPPFLPSDGTVLPVLMKAQMTWLDLLDYFRTWSSLHSYHATHPDDLQRPDDQRFLGDDLAKCARETDRPPGESDTVGGGDIAVRFWKDLREEVLVIDPKTQVGLLDSVQVEWPVALLLARKV